MTRLLFIACLAGFIAGSIDERPAAAIAFGMAAIYFFMRALTGRYVKELFEGETIPPPPMPKELDVTLDEIADEPSHTRRIRGNTPAKDDKGKVA